VKGAVPEATTEKTAWSPSQTARLWGAVAIAVVGFTVIVNCFDVPLQLTPFRVYVGTTIMVAVTGAVPLFTGLKEFILPVPLAASPMLVVLFVQA
jgi:hypothetical protein